MLLLEMGANMEDSDDEVYTPIMEASRESHEEMAAGDCSDICRSAKKGYLYLSKFHIISDFISSLSRKLHESGYIKDTTKRNPMIPHIFIFDQSSGQFVLVSPR